MRIPYKWKAFGAVSLSLFVMVMDQSALNVILPEIAESFSVRLSIVSWVTIIGGLTISSTLLPLGKLADLMGRRKVHIIGMGLFGIGSLICYFSSNISTLLAGRILSSIGSSMDQAVVMAIVLAVFPKNERGKGLGMITFAVGLGAIAGPLIGGQISQLIGWRFVFLIMFFPTFLALSLAYLVLKDSLIGSPQSSEKERYDWKGAIYSALFIIILIINIINPLNMAYSSPIYWSSWLICISIFIIFVRSQLTNPFPMFNLYFFTKWRFSFAVAARLTGFMSNAPFWFLIPFYATIVLGYSISLTGILIFLNAVGMSFAGSVGGRLSDKFGTLKFILSGLLALTISWILLIFLPSNTPVIYIAFISLFNGASNGLWMAPNTSETLEDIDVNSQGIISAFNALIRNVGSVIGISISTTLITFILITNGLDVEINDLKTGTDSEILILANAMRYAFVMLASFSILGIILSICGRIKDNSLVKKRVI
jgi:MFS family permease